MRSLVTGLVALPLLIVVALALLFPAYEGLPPGWVIVAVLFGIPMLGMAVRRLFDH